jgi:sugar phosphate permease
MSELVINFPSRRIGSENIIQNPLKKKTGFILNQTQELQSSDKPFYGWKNAAVLTFIFMATTGLVFYAFSVIFPVMLKDTGWSRGDASIAISLGILAGGFLIPFAAKLINKVGTRKVIIIGLAILFLDLLLLSTTTTKLWHWIVIWGVLTPIGRVLCGIMPSQVNIMFWFNRKRAMAIGLLMTGAPIGGFIAPPVYTWFMNYMGGWRAGWMLSTGVVLMALALSFLVRSKPSDMGQHPDGITPGAPLADGRQNSSEGARTFRTQTAWTLREVLKSRTIWLITAANITLQMGLGVVVFHGVLHLTDIGYSAMNAAFILSTIIVSSGVVRFPVGWLGDRVEPRWIIFTALIIMVIGFIGIWKAPSFGLLMVLGPIYGISYGVLLTIVPTITGNYYGPEVFASINGFFGPFLTVIGAAVPTIAGYAVEKLGSYNEIFLVITFLLIAGTVCSAFLSPPRKKEI